MIAAAIVPFHSYVVSAAEPDAGPPEPRLGINIAGPADWNTELPFVDVFRLSRTWISQREGAGWGKGPQLELDEQGWVTRLADGCWAETPLCTIEGGHYPSGVCTVLYEGDGAIEFWGAATIKSSQPGRLLIDVDSSKGGFFVRLKETSPGNHVRNIRVIMPGHEESYVRDPWRPGFLNQWRGVACLRFMDFMETNNSKIATWQERPRVEDATFTRHGVPLELMVNLANRLHADPWFCMPHHADDDFVQHFAATVKEQLDPTLNVYVEYSNEVWNGQFSQHHFAAEQGQKLGLAENQREAAWRYTAVRSVEIFEIWADAFGGTERLVRVLPAHAANPYVAQQIVPYRDAYKHADALAIAPYISLMVAPGGELPAATVAAWNVDQLLDHVQSKSLPQSIGWIEQYKAIAEKFGLKLVAYEAGQHLVGIQGAENNEQLTALLQQANAHPRMGDIYARYLAGWEENGGDLLCHFSSVSQWSKWGSWGTMQFADDNPAASPKYSAIMEWAKSCSQPVSWPRR